MTPEELMLVKGALAALSQNKTFAPDVVYARRCLTDAIAAHERDEAETAMEAEMYATLEREAQQAPYQAANLAKLALEEDTPRHGQNCECMACYEAWCESRLED